MQLTLRLLMLALLKVALAVNTTLLRDVIMVWGNIVKCIIVSYFVGINENENHSTKNNINRVSAIKNGTEDETTTSGSATYGKGGLVGICTMIAVHFMGPWGMNYA